jgi:hypothetical protein
MAMLIADHHLKDFDAWFAIFSRNPPPDIGTWKMWRGTDDPNRVFITAEGSDAEIEAIKELFATDEWQAVFKGVNEMSTAPMEFNWLEEPPHG